MEAFNSIIASLSLLLTAVALVGVYFAWLSHVHTQFERTYDSTFERLKTWLVDVADITERHMVNPRSVAESEFPPFGVEVRDYLRHGFEDDVIQVFAHPPAPVRPSYYEAANLVPQCTIFIYELTDVWRQHNDIDSGGGYILSDDRDKLPESTILGMLYSLHERSTLLLDHIGTIRQQISADGSRVYRARHPIRAFKLRRACETAADNLRNRLLETRSRRVDKRLPGDWLG